MPIYHSFKSIAYWLGIIDIIAPSKRYLYKKISSKIHIDRRINITNVTVWSIHHRGELKVGRLSIVSNPHSTLAKEFGTIGLSIKEDCQSLGHGKQIIGEIIQHILDENNSVEIVCNRSNIPMLKIINRLNEYYAVTENKFKDNNKYSVSRMD